MHTIIFLYCTVTKQIKILKKNLKYKLKYLKRRILEYLILGDSNNTYLLYMCIGKLTRLTTSNIIEALYMQYTYLLK